MSRKSVALMSSIFEGDCVSLDETAESYFRNRLYMDDTDREIKVKPNKKSKKRDKPGSQKSQEGGLNRESISNVLVDCLCNKCGASAEGTLLSYLQLQTKSIPFVVYSCCECHHTGYRSVSTKALPHLEFDKLYFS